MAYFTATLSFQLIYPYIQLEKELAVGSATFDTVSSIGMLTNNI